MTRVLASAADAGRPCPYCHFPLKEGVAAERCDACNSLHHEDCWRDGGGCAVLGCVQAGRATTGSAGPVGPQYTPGVPISPQPPPPHVYPGYAPAPGYPPRPSPPSRQGSSQVVLVLAIVIALLGVGTGVVVATGVLSGGTASGARRALTVAGTTSTSSSTTPAPTKPAGPTPSERASDRGAIVSLLDGYEVAYSQHNVSALSNLFSPGVSRHGLAAGGCTVSHGRGAVLDDYQSQFEQGSGSYELVGLSAGEIQIESMTRAHIDVHYQITPGGTGYVNFRFAELGEGWKISEVYATCE